MKIAIVYDAIYPYVKGGAEKRIYDLCKKLSKKHEVHLFGMKYWQGNRIIKNDGVYLHGICNSISLYNKKGRRSLIEPLYFSFNLFKELRKYDFDLIDCQNFPYFPCFVSKFYSVLKRKPLVITWLELWKDDWKEKRILGYFGMMIEKLCISLTKNNVVLTKESGEKLHRAYSVFPVGIDLEKIKMVKAGKEKFDIIFVGRLIKEKKVDSLLRAVKDLDIRVCIIGDGPEKINLVDLACKLGLKNVSFKGFLDSDEEVYSYMRSSEILVLPSIREGFGVVVLEALACGCKVITTNHHNNHARFLVDENFICRADVESLREKIRYGFKSDYNNKINLEEYDIEVIAKKIEEYYTGCIDEK